MATDYYIGMRFRRISDWCHSYGYAGWPNFHWAQKLTWEGAHGPIPVNSTLPYSVYGHLLLRDAVVDWRDVPESEYNAVDMRTRFTGAHDYAIRQGYQHGFPNFHQAAGPTGVVNGTFLIVPGTCQHRDVSVFELFGFGGDRDPTILPMDRWIQAAHDYAWPRGYVTGMPNGHYANHGQGFVCGVMLFPRGTAEWADIHGYALGLPY